MLPTGDWLAHLGQEEDGGFQLTYRFRWYRDEKGFDSIDDRNWYAYKIKPGESVDKLLAVTRQTFQKFIDSDYAGWELMRGERTADEFAELLASMPNVEIRKERKL
jgi:hypothetical protein